MSEQLFTSTPAATTAPVEQTTTPSQPSYADLLGSIKNEHGQQKYATIEDALKGLQNAQEYIPQIKSQVSEKDAELMRLREELAKRKSVEEVIASLRPQQPVEQVVTPTSQPSQGLSQEEIQALVLKQLNQAKAQEVSQSNVSKVRSALVSKYGEKAQEVAAARATELGMSMDTLSALSASSPDAVLALLNATSAPAPTGAPVRSSVTLPDSQRTIDLTPEKSMLYGASNKDVLAYMEKIRQKVLQENGLA